MLKIRIKTKNKEQNQNIIHLNKFFIQYFQNLLIELNSVLSDYHSIQEHASRNKIIEFSSKKIKDLDLLQVVVKGIFLLENLQYLTFKSDDCISNGNKIIEMADFLAILYENMKTSFIPRPNFDLALQTFIDHSKLLPITVYNSINTSNIDDNINISSDEMDYIHRMMKIYLIKEDINNYRLDNGILIIESKYFTFELALCGNFLNPTWQLFKVKSFSENKRIDDQLLRRLNTISAITKFIKLFENRKNAMEIFDFLDSKTGFFQNFSGTVNNIECHGYFKNIDFYFNISKIEYKNPNIDDIKKILVINKEDKRDSDVSITDIAIFEYKSDLFGPNHTLFIQNMFFSISTKQNICFFGNINPICGINPQILRFKIENEVILGEINTSAVDNNPFDLNLAINFINNNFEFLSIINELKDLKICAEINKSIKNTHFFVDSSFNTYFIDKNNEKHKIENKNCINTIRLIILQNEIPERIEIIENIVGEKFLFKYFGLILEITDKIKTNDEILNEDISSFNINQAFNYIKSFSLFYIYHLTPTIFTENKLCFDFTNFIDEMAEVTVINDQFFISAPKTLEISKMPNTFTFNDPKMFHILYKFFLTDRFIFLKKQFELTHIKSNSNEIYINGNTKMYLTQEGIIFKGEDEEVNMKLGKMLNFQRDIYYVIREIKNRYFY